MDILSYLSTLIKTHKEVGIPGLGTIYKRKSPGRYDVDTHSFLPPSYILNFTSDLNEQTLLTELISKKKNISADAAIYFVEQFAQHTLDELAANQQSDFGDLGTFSTSSGSLTFIPKQESNLGFDFYGLPKLKTEPDTEKVKIAEEDTIPEQQSSIEDQPLAQTENGSAIPAGIELSQEQLELENNNVDLSDGTEESNEAVSETAENEVLISHLDSTESPVVEREIEHDEQPVYEEIAEITHAAETQNHEPAPLIQTPETENNLTEDVQPEKLESPVNPNETVHFTLDYTGQEKKGIPGYLKVIIALVAILILAGLTFLAKPELFDGILKKPVDKPVMAPDTTASIKNIEQIKIDSTAYADSIRRSNERAILAADSAKDSLTLKKTPVTVPPVAGNELTYEIIAASLLNQREADNFLKDMKKKGIAAKVADMPGRRVKISIGSFADEETAKKELEVLKKTTKIPGIYIYKVRHTNNPK